MPRILTLFAALTLAALPACRSTRKEAPATPADAAAADSGSPTGPLPPAIRPEDRAAVKAFYQKGGSAGFHLSDDQRASPLTPENSRFIVDLDAGATLIAVQQNSHATSSELGAMRGQRVTLMWNTEHEIPVG